MIDFTKYKNAAKYAMQINEGYTASLYGIDRDKLPYPYHGEFGQAWRYGHNLATKHVTEKSPG